MLSGHSHESLGDGLFDRLAVEVLGEDSPVGADQEPEGGKRMPKAPAIGLGSSLSPMYRCSQPRPRWARYLCISSGEAS